jgi:hypothetical protein
MAHFQKAVAAPMTIPPSSVNKQKPMPSKDWTAFFLLFSCGEHFQ